MTFVGRHTGARVQKLLNFGARVISGRRIYEHISDVLKDLQWLSAENLWRYHSLTMLRRTFHSGQPESLRSGIMTGGSVHDRSTRQADSFETSAIHTESGRRRFLYSTVSMYNSLPRELPELPPPPRSSVFNAARICCERSTAMSRGVCVCMLVVLRCVYENVSVLPIFTYAFYIRGIIFSQPIIRSFCTKISSFWTTHEQWYFSSLRSISDHFGNNTLADQKRYFCTRWYLQR